MSYAIDRRIAQLEKAMGNSEYVNFLDFLRCIGVDDRVEAGKLSPEDGEACKGEILRGRHVDPRLAKFLATVVCSDAAANSAAL